MNTVKVNYHATDPNILRQRVSSVLEPILRKQAGFQSIILFADQTMRVIIEHPL